MIFKTNRITSDVVRYVLHAAAVCTLLIPEFLYGQKCGTQEQIERFFQFRQEPQKLIVPLSMTDSVISPSGMFIIHYTKSGDSACTDEYAAMAARTADEAYRFEVEELGYPKPPFSYDDSMWHIYIVNLGATVYGYTSPILSGYLGDSPAGIAKYRSYMVIDNDYAGYATPGFDGATVTIYHEFFHIIQFAVYGIKSEHGNFREMSSVWMEIRSQPMIKDYIFYLSRLFETLDATMDQVGGGGYAQGVWLQFLQLKFGDEFIKKLWQTYSEKIPVVLSAFDQTCASYGTTFCSEYKAFGAELFFTGRRFRGRSVFPDARLFPADHIQYHKLDFGQTGVYDFILPASLQFVASGDTRDTSVVVIARNTNMSFVSSDTVMIEDYGRYRAAYQFPETFCDTIVKVEPTTADAYPMPFIIGSGETEFFKALAGDKKPVSKPRMMIYTASMQLVRSQETDPQPTAGRWFIEWDGRDDTGKFVASGIYVYTIEVDGSRRTGKVSVIRK